MSASSSDWLSSVVFFPLAVATMFLLATLTDPVAVNLSALLAPPLAFATLWYALPVIVSVSLVCAATRHELMRPIVEHAARFGVWVLVFMGLFVGLLALLERMV